jgi:acetoin utilization deacetylase AcuC-like enzyme
MQVTTAGFAAFAARARAVADEVCGGKLVLALEGGYDLEALADSVAETVRVLAEPAPRAREYPAGSARAGQLARIFREAHARFWPTLERRIQG